MLFRGKPYDVQFIQFKSMFGKGIIMDQQRVYQMRILLFNRYKEEVAGDIQGEREQKRKNARGKENRYPF